MNLFITHYPNNPQISGDNAGWTVWTTKTTTLQLARTQVQNINFFLTRDIMGKSDEHYAYNPTKIRIVGAATGFDPAQFQQAFNSVFLHAKTRDAFLELVTFDTPDCPSLLDDIKTWIETEIQSVQQAYPDEKEHSKAS